MRRPLLVRRAWLICAVLSAVPRSARFRRIASQRWEKTTAVAVKIKLKRLGKIREPYYRIVVADARTKRDGRAIEEIGKYHPKAEPSLIEVNSERVQHWLSVGAQQNKKESVRLKIKGDWKKITGEQGTLRTAEPRADKKERFEAAAKESQASKQAKEGAKESKAPSKASKPARSSAAKDRAPAAEAADAEATSEAAADTKAADTKAADTKSADTKAADAKAADTK